MIDQMKKTTATVAALAALGGGAALAGAQASNSSASSGSGSTTSSTTAQPDRGHGSRGPGAALSSADAAKVKQAALDKVPGATVVQAKAGGSYGTPYHAHITTSDGTLKVVTVDSSFEAVSVVADQGRGGGRSGPGGNHTPETALTGDTKQKTEDAVLARYPGATIVRTESNTDGSAPYESHITTKDGRQLKVLVSKDFEVVG